MNVIVPFVGKSDRTAQQNLEAFIEHTRGSKIFQGSHANDWADNSWDLTPWVQNRGSSRTYKPHFVRYESQGRSTLKAPLPQPFLDAAKALVTYGFSHYNATTPYRWNIALRTIEKACRDLGRPSDITVLDYDILNRAAAIVQGDYANPTDVATSLEKVCDTINRLCLCGAPLLWKFPYDKNWGRNYDATAVSSTISVEISTKLPHLKCVLDLASVFQNASSSADVITTAWFALSMYAPSRVSEILALPVGCETEMDGVYGIAWQPSKGGDPMTKFATTDEWADVASLAIKRLLELGAPARRAAAWYEKHPTMAYLPPGMEHLRDEPLTRLEIQRMIGSEFIDAGTMNRMGIKPSGLTTRDTIRADGKVWAKLYTFASVEHWILAQLPAQWLADKVLGVHAKDALFCVPRHSMSSKWESQLHIPMLVNDNQINHDLTQRDNTIFHRHDLRHPDTGEVWKITTHQPRHFLNTLAQSKHLSQTLIAFWSGRKKIDQNHWYNHIPKETLIEAYVAMGEYAPREIKLEGPLVEKVAVRARKEFISKDEALRLELGSIIATRYGLCRHNYALTPCPKDKDCIQCGENTFIKGDPGQIEEARKQLRISQMAVANCRRDMEDGEPGVERWLLKHERDAERWGRALDRLTDTALEDGTLITLPPPEISQSKAGLSQQIHQAEAAAPVVPDGDGIDFPWLERTP